MDLQYFMHVLWKRKWLLLVVGLVAAVATFFLVGLTPYKFKSRAVIETNFLNNARLNVLGDNPFIQAYQAESMFSEVMEQMKSRPVLKLLSEELLYHDLSADGVEVQPFRVPEVDEDITYSRSELEDFVAVLSSTKDTLAAPRLEKHNRLTFNELAKAFEYDPETLYEDLEVARKGESDYVAIEFTSEHPGLSYFAVQKFCEEFLNFYEADILATEDSDVRKFREELASKRAVFRRLTKELDAYRSENNIVDVEKQSSTLIERISELNVAIEQERQNILKQKKALATTTREIGKIAPSMNDGFAKKQYLNEDLEKIQQEIKLLRNQYLAGGRQDKALEEKLKNLAARRDDIGRQMALYEVRNERLEDSRLEDLLEKKVDAEIELQSAENALQGYEAEIRRLTGDQAQMVTDDAGYKNLKSEWDLAQIEYQDAKYKFDQAEIKANIHGSQMKIFEPAEIPDEAEPRHRAVLGAFAGVAGTTLTTVLLFLLTFFDRSFSNPEQFKKMSSLPFLGMVNKLKDKQLDLAAIFGSNAPDKNYDYFKEAVRKLRYTLEASDARSFLITSNKKGEGKSFITLTLAYALSLNNRRVLVVDTNFKNNSLSAFSNVPNDENPLLTSGQTVGNTGSNLGTQNFRMSGVDIMGNVGDARSASEVLAGKNLRSILRNYELEYDYILLEAAALNEYSDARELSQFVDKVILVADAENKLTNEDQDSYAFLRNLGGKLLGSILNKVSLKEIK